MKKIYLLITAVLTAFQVHSQYLDLPEVIQEQNEWCWAGVSKSILYYYGVPKEQCEIADYARTVIIWRDFGSDNCCENPSGNCNYWNYNWGSAGSIQDILVHFGDIENHGVSSSLSLATVNEEISAGHPFVIRWGWKSGGGHFVIGHGISGNQLSYMDPWFGEGYHTSTYSWVDEGPNHDWTHTNVITTNLSTEELENNIKSIELFPNPAHDNLHIKSMKNMNNIRVFNSMGMIVDEYLDMNQMDFDMKISQYPVGMYLLEIKIDSHLETIKFIKE